MAKSQRKKKKKVLTSDEGVAHIKATFNNTNITLTDLNGNVIAWSTACLLYTSPSPRDGLLSRMPSSA